MWSISARREEILAWSSASSFSHSSRRRAIARRSATHGGHSSPPSSGLSTGPSPQFERFHAQLVHLVGERAHAQRVGGAGVGHRRRRRDVGREHHGAGMLVAEARPLRRVEREASTHDVFAARRALVRPVGVAAAVPRRRPRARVGREVDRLVLLRHGSGARHCVEERLPLRAVRACSLQEAVDERRDRERRGRVAGRRAEGEGERGGIDLRGTSLVCRPGFVAS